MTAFRQVLSLVFVAAFSAPSYSVTNAQVFAYAEANFPTLFSGTPALGQVAYQGMSYDYRYYAASRHFLAVDTAGTISVLGPNTDNRIVAVGAVADFASAIGHWESSAIPFSVTAHEASGNCTLYDDRIMTGRLTPAGQTNVYTTLFVANTLITLTVPGSNTLSFSFPDDGGTTTENLRLSFDANSQVTGSSSWTHSNGCMGNMTFAGSLGNAGESAVSPFNGTYAGTYSSSAVTAPFTATVANGIVTIAIGNGTGGTGIVTGAVSASGVGALTNFSGFACPPTSGSLQIVVGATGGAAMSAVSSSPPECNDGPSGTWTATRS